MEKGNYGKKFVLPKLVNAEKWLLFSLCLPLQE